MNLLAIPEADLDPVPRFFMQGRDSDPASEVQRVVAFRRELRKVLPDARIVATPNARHWGQKALNQARSEGMVAGWPDLQVLHQGKIVHLEFKNGKNMPKPHQVEQLNWLVDNGFHAALVRTAPGALWFLKQKGWPV